MMGGDDPRPLPALSVSGRDASEVTTIPVLAERLLVSKRLVERGRIRVATTTRERVVAVDEALTHERIEIEHVPIGRMVDAVPPVREEGDTTILSVVEEVVVVERRLMLKEEVHIRRVRVTEQYCDTVVLREQDVVITRTGVGQETGESPEPSGNIA